MTNATMPTVTITVGETQRTFKALSFFNDSFELDQRVNVIEMEILVNDQETLAAFQSLLGQMLHSPPVISIEANLPKGVIRISKCKVADIRFKFANRIAVLSAEGVSE